MSTIIQIQVTTEDAKALASLTNLEALAKRLSDTPVKIKIEANALDKGAKDTIKLANALAREAKEATKAASEARKLTSEVRKLGKETTSATQKTDKFAAGTGKAAQGTQKMGEEAKKTSRLTDLLGDSLGKIIAKQAAWQIIGNAVTAVKKSFSDALGTMKEVDSELATIRKVTGATADEMKSLGNEAYSTASQYGADAKEYLEGVAVFARAGYKDKSADLGELAIKTQLVGDTTSETAQKFLLAADAAWKFNGDAGKLSLTLDKANEIDNNYATSIQKLAEGFPIVANVAAQAGMTVDQTMAALGTITATTQETGTKAATALRALILNILGDTTTEIENGVTATTESIESMGQILQKYAPDAVAAAEATGKLINPMEAIEALSEAAKDGLLTEADLMQLVSSLGGKLRSNQLLALLENFDMYSSMLNTMSTAAGSAEKEISVMLDTWDAKANILKNTWTEFVSHLANTEAIKGGLDAATGLVKALDSDLGHLIITTAAFTAGTVLLAKGLDAAKAKTLKLAMAQGPLAAGTLTSAAAFKTLTASAAAFIAANPLLVAFGATIATVTVLANLVDDLTVSYDEQVEKVNELQAAYDAAYGDGSRLAQLEELKEKTEALTEAEERELQVLKARADLDKLELEKAQQEEYDKWNSRWGGQEVVSAGPSGSYVVQTGYTNAAAKLNEYKLAVAGLNAEYAEGKMLPSEYAKGLADINSGYIDLVEQVEKYRAQDRKIPPELEKLAELYFDNSEIIGEYADTLGDSSDATDQQTSSLQEQAEAADAATAAIERYNARLKQLGDREANANAMQDSFNTALEDFQAGKLGSANLRAFLEEAIPDDIFQEMGYSVADGMQYVMDSAIGKVLQSNDMGAAWYDALAGGVADGSLDGIVQFDSEGVITAISSYHALAEAMGTTEAMAQSLTEYLSNYMDGIFYTNEEAANIVSEIGDMIATSVSDGETSLGDFINALSQVTGLTSSMDLFEAMEGLDRAGAIDWETLLGVSSAEEAKALIMAALDELVGKDAETAQKAADTPIKPKFDASDLNTGAAQLEKFAQKKHTNIEVKATGAEDTAHKVGEVAEKADEIPEAKTTVLRAQDYASATISRVKKELDGLKNKTVTVTVRQSGSARPYADGTDNAPGGVALVNDGKPVAGSAAELIVDNGQAFIANDGKPTLVNLSPHAKVYTAKETRDIVSNRESMAVPAFAGGTGLIKPGGGGIYSKTSGKGSSGSGNNDKDPLIDEVNAKLNNLDKQIKLAQNQNDKVREQALQGEAAKLVKEYVDKLLGKGFSVTSDEVLDLLNKGYGYSDDLMNELVDSLDALTDATEKANTLAEKQADVDKAREALENAKKQRTVRIYNEDSGQWEWIAKADDIQKAQEKLESAQKSLDDVKKDIAGDELEQWLETLKKANIGDVSGIEISPAVRELLSGASEEEQRRIADILKAITGGASNTVDTTGESIYRNSDSHDVYYQFGDIKLSDTQASSMTVKELANQLRALRLT